MATDESSAQMADGREPLFASTHWSVVLAAGQSDTSAHDALAHLCKILLVSALCTYAQNVVGARRTMPRT